MIARRPRYLTFLGALALNGGGFAHAQDGEVVFFPIEDEATVDARRAEMGMPPLAEHRELMKRMYLPNRK